MPTQDGLAIARERITREAFEKTGFLDLGQLDLTTFPEELLLLKHLHTLSLGDFYLGEDGYWQEAAGELRPNDLQRQLHLLVQLPKLRSLFLSSSPLSDLRPLLSLTTLQFLDIAGTNVSDISPLSCLANLQSVDCSGTEVTDLLPLSGLANLRSVYCAATSISDLSPLSCLENLQSIDFSGTQVSDLSPLSCLTNLQSVDFSRTQVSDLSPLSCLVNLQSVKCAGAHVSDLSPLSCLVKLQSVEFARTDVSDLLPLSGLANLQSVDLSETLISDLSPLSHLTNLQSINCSRLNLSDLSPLSGLGSLRSVKCSGTKVSDLLPLSGLANLQSVDCSQSQVSDLSPLSALANLKHVGCSRTLVSDLSPLSLLDSLESVDCSQTEVSDLLPLSLLGTLESVDCSQTEISDLSPLSSLASLESIDCSETQVSDILPLSGLANLQSASCSGIGLSDISPLAELSNLEFLYTYNTRIPGIPNEVLSQTLFDNCLGRLRAHLLDLTEGKEAVTDLKLMVLGNGRVGKTQICRQLQGDSFDIDVPSTHGIIVSSACLPGFSKAEATKLHIWDFGGQDIYHGTHALFMRARAIFLLVWAADAENSTTHEHGGITFRNHPLPYWLAYVRHLGGADSPLLVVQTRCDHSEDDARRLPVLDEALEGFRFCKPQLHFSSQTGRGRAALDEVLREAVIWLQEKHSSSCIGAGRMRVQRRLEALRDQDAKAPVAERNYRTLTQELFRQICIEEGGVSSSDHLLDYLHNTGLVFYRQGLFHDSIILDQGWALEAIYAVFNRDKCYRHLRNAKGRFTRSLLDVLVWQEYGREEQKLFLSMMESCGVCFVHRRGGSDEGIENEYIAPDMLPDRSGVAAELDEKWDSQQPTEEEVIAFELLHPGLLSCLVARIGASAGINGLYWKDGVCVWEKHTQSHALIEQECYDDWRGIIRVCTQGGQAKLLLERLLELIDKEQSRFGFRRRDRRQEQPRHRPESHQHTIQAEPLEPEQAKLEFAQQPKDASEYCISYAWGDTTKEGKDREQVVDCLCAEAAQRGVEILRDKSVLGLGESITRFMNRIGKADRVFVILSDKYLRSPYCMYELYEIWQYSRRDEVDFLHRVRVYTLSCAKIFSLSDRLEYSRHWKDEFSAVEAKIKELGAAFIGETVLRKFRLMDDFAKHVGEILETLADIVQPRTFEELVSYGLKDIEPEA